MSIAELLIELLSLALLQLLVIYVAAFVYRLNWYGVLTTMTISSVLIAGVTKVALARFTPKDNKGPYVAEGFALLLLALLSSLAVFLLLWQRFNFPMALGISLLSGLLSTWMGRIF